MAECVCDMLAYVSDVASLDCLRNAWFYFFECALRTK